MQYIIVRRMPCGQACGFKPFTGSPGVLLIPTQGRPTHLTCGQTMARIMIPRPESWRKGKPPPLFGQTKSLGSRSTGRFPKLETGCALERPRAFSAVARPGGNVPAWLYSDFKVQKRLLFCPFTDIAAKGPIKPSLIPKKFLSFSAAVPSSDRLPLQKCRLFVRFHGCCIHPFS